MGPQNDYFKEEKTTLSKILPFFGGCLILLLVLGMLAGIAVMTGFIGGNNYLQTNEDGIVAKQTTGSVEKVDTIVVNGG